MNIRNSLTIPAITILCLLVVHAVASAEGEITIKGVIKSVDLDMKTFVISAYDGKEVVVTIGDPALAKFEKGIIRENDEVVVRCIRVNEKLQSISFFKKPRGS